MVGELVLLTGGTGFVGFTILVKLLQSGYRVRVAARSQAKIDRVLATPSITALNPPDTQLMFAIVPDMATEGAYDDAVQDVDFIIHAAAPLPAIEEGSAASAKQLEETFVKASVQGNLGILKSANDKSNTVKRIVITSSTVAIAPVDVILNGSKTIRGPESRVAIPDPPYQSELQAYCVGKAKALNAAEAFVSDNATSFDLISIIPSCILGKDELVNNIKHMRANTSSALVIDILTGSQSPAGVGNAVLCEDVARAHVRALEPSIKGNQSFIVNTEVEWDDAIPIARKYLPEAFETGLFRESGRKPTKPLRWNSNTARDVLGINFALFDTMVLQVASQYLQLVKREQK